MNSDTLLTTIFTSISINELLAKMDESQKNSFLRQLFNYLKTNIEAHDNNGFGLESFVDFVGYDGESNSIVVSKNELYSDYTDDGVVEYPAGLSSEYKISIDELQNRIDSLVSSKQDKTR